MSEHGEYRLAPVTLQVIVPPLHKSDEQIDDILLGTWPTVISCLHTATAKRSSGLLNSILQGRTSPIAASHIALYQWYPRIIDSTSKLVRRSLAILQRKLSEAARELNKSNFSLNLL